MPRAADLIRRAGLLRRRPLIAGEAQQTLALLPWLNLNARVAVGPMLLDRLSRVVPEMSPDAAPTAEAIANSFRDIRGQRVDVSMCWFADRNPTAEISESEVETVRDYILAAMIS